MKIGDVKECMVIWCWLLWLSSSLSPGDHRHGGCDGGGFFDDAVRWGTGQVLVFLLGLEGF